ncbi:MAG: hypothetical protein U0324_40925 [Polyangiales bacterium]
MTTVADRLREVLTAERLSDARGASLLAWAEPFGDDLAGAWAACPRADHLVIVAGAFHAPLGALVRAAGKCVRPAAALAPKKDVPHATRAVYAAEQWGGAASKPLRDLPRQLRLTATRLRKEHEAQGDRHLARSVAALTPLLRGPAERALAAQRESPEGAGAVLEADVAGALAAAEARGEVRAVAEELRQGQAAQASVIALLAASELGDAVGAATAVVLTMAKLTSLGERDVSPSAEAVRELAAEGDAFEAGLYDDLARAVSLAAEATARDAAGRWAAAGAEGFRDTLARTVLEAALHATARPGEPLPVLPLHREVERVIAAERLGRLRAMADALRAAVPAPKG